MIFSGLSDRAAKSPRFVKYREAVEEMRRLSDASKYSALVEMLESMRKIA